MPAEALAVEEDLGEFSQFVPAISTAAPDEGLGEFSQFVPPPDSTAAFVAPDTTDLGEFDQFVPKSPVGEAEKALVETSVVPTVTLDSPLPRASQGERPPLAETIAGWLDSFANTVSGGRTGPDTLTKLVKSSTYVPEPGEPSFTNAGIPTIPQQEGAVAETAAGLANVPIGFANFLLSPGGVATMHALGMAPKLAQTLVGVGFTAEQANQFLNAETTQEKITSGVGAALLGLGTAAGAIKGRGETTTTELPVATNLVERAPQSLETKLPVASESPPEPGTPAAEINSAMSRVEDFIPSEQAFGITPFKGRSKDALVDPTELQSIDPKVETRWQDATRTEASIWLRGKEAAKAVKNEFTRADPHLDPKTDALFIDAARRFRTIPRHSQELAANIMRGFTAGLGKNKFEVFQRNVILNDLARDVEAGRYADRELPFGYTPESLKADVSKFGDLAKSNPAVTKALEVRNQFMGTLKKELVENGLLPKEVMKEGDYFHRQVVQYLNTKEAFTTGTGSGDVRTHMKGFQRERTHSAKDYNTKYLEAEYEVMSQSLGQLRTVKALEEFRAADIKPSLVAEAKKSGVDWKSLVPEDHTIWQPKEGNVFYQAMTIPEKIIDGILKGDRELSKTDLREVLAMGGAREQWVVPKRIAKTLDNIAPKMEEGVISDLARKATNGWKVWILLNPARSIKYGLNNLSGDLDISFAYSPKIASQYGPKAASDMRRYVLKRAALTPEISEGIEKGVLSSGFSVAEVPDINAHQFFRVVSGENPSLIERAWQKNKDYHNWRENTLRLAAWRFFKDKMVSAKEGERFYAASRKSEIDGLYDAGAPPSDIAAKLSRELIGDYGNISHAGQWIRTHAIPFYSWMEINAPRYVRLLKNAASEGEGNVAARATGVLGKRGLAIAVGKTVKTAGLAAGMYGLVNIWNHTFFAKEEEELGEGRRQLHLILGRNEDGTIKTLRIQGALSDALSWVGAEDLPSDVADVSRGRETVGDKVLDAVKAPPTKIISGVTPFVKTPVEALTRRSLFPDPFNPRPVRDPVETIAQMFSLEKPYRYFTDKPMRPVMNEIAGLVTYTTDPGEAAYHMTRGLVANWSEKQGDEKGTVIPTQRQNALFYHKKAVQLGEIEKAKRWKERYFNMGGTNDGIKKSVKASSPLGSLSKKNRSNFMGSLTPKERKVVTRAVDWYEKVY